jgi:hypothetical protein
LEEAKMITLLKPGKDHKFSQNLRPISLLSTMGKISQKVTLKVIQRQVEEKGLLNASQFGFHVRHSTILYYMRLTDHVILNCNSNISMAVVFLDIEKAFDVMRHTVLLYKLSKLEFSTSLIKLISSFTSQRKFRISAESEISAPRKIQAGMPQGSVMFPTLYIMYINDAPKHLVFI